MSHRVQTQIEIAFLLHAILTASIFFFYVTNDLIVTELISKRLLLHCHVSCLVFFDFFLVVDEFRAEILFALLSDEALDLHRMEGGL